MSRQKLTIVVTCTDRKSATPSDELMARNLPAWTGQRARRVMASGDSTRSPADAAAPRPVQRRDAGPGRCPCSARRTRLGFEPDVLVASAGLGLACTSRRPAPAYGATFARTTRTPSAIHPRVTRSWWAALPPCRRRVTAGSSRSGSCRRLLMRRRADEICMTWITGRDILVFGGSREIPDRRARPVGPIAAARARGHRHQPQRPHGNAVAHLSRMARIRSPAPRGTRGALGSHEQRHREVYDRKPMTDAEVLDVRQRTCAMRNPRISKTSALQGSARRRARHASNGASRALSQQAVAR